MVLLVCLIACCLFNYKLVNFVNSVLAFDFSNVHMCIFFIVYISFVKTTMLILGAPIIEKHALISVRVTRLLTAHQ